MSGIHSFSMRAPNFQKSRGKRMDEWEPGSHSDDFRNRIRSDCQWSSEMRAGYKRWVVKWETVCSDTVISYLMSNVAWAVSLKIRAESRGGAGLEKTMWVNHVQESDGTVIWAMGYYMDNYAPGSPCTQWSACQVQSFIQYMAWDISPTLSSRC